MFFVFGVDYEENELLILETIHRYVEVLDGFFGNVCELDLVFNLESANYVLNEFILGGQIIESSRKAIARALQSSINEANTAISQKSNSLTESILGI